MRPWLALAVLALQIGVPREAAATEPAEAPALVIPEQAPKRAPGDPSRPGCGTGRLSTVEYEQWWSYWRAVALSTEDPAHRECHGFALTQLAQLTANQGYESATYWRAALAALEGVLADGDPRLASARLSLAQERETPMAEKERLIHSSLAALEAAVARPQEVSALGCSSTRQSPDVKVFTFAADLRAGTPAEQRKLLSQAQLAQLALLVESTRTEEALVVARATQRYLEERLALGDAEDRTSYMNQDASRLVYLLGRLPPSQVPQPELAAAVDLLRRVAPEGVLDQGRGLFALADYHVARHELGSAEEALLLVVRLSDEAENEGWGGALKVLLSNTTRSLAIYRLADIYELQHRWADLERLYLENVSVAREADAKTLGQALQRLIYLYRRRGRHEEALTLLRDLDQIVPDVAYTHEQLASTLVELERWQEAEAELFTARGLLGPQVEPDSGALANLDLHLAHLYQKTGQAAAADGMFAEAMASYDAALARQRPGVSLWVVRCSKARVLVDTGHLDEAEALYLQVEEELASTPDSHPASRTMPLFGRMRIAAERGDPKRAGDLLEEAARACSAGWEEGTAGRARCLGDAATRAADAGLEELAADLRRRADEVTAWARNGETAADGTARPLPSPGSSR